MSNIQPISREKSDRERVYARLRDAILFGDIQPNEHIVETVYARILGISRTPVREALRMLERDGLVTYSPKKGATARGYLTEDEAEQVFSIRALLQSYSVPPTVQNITEEELKEMHDCCEHCLAALEEDDLAAFFHNHDRFNLLLVKSSKNPVLIRLLLEMENYNPITSFAGSCDDIDTAYVRKNAVPTRQRRYEAVNEHINLWKALKNRDAEAFKAALDEHLEHSKAACVSSIKSIRCK
ncbi:MAG: GntR family transcriptional regulator [Clostridiaceae bacterium]|nr:GntR family transcriptional regulator [Eubacteriales bacterium]